jgi:Tol biopolymer transport system component
MVGPPIGYDAWSPDISSDGLSLYFASSRGEYGQDDIWVATRTTINDPWGEPVNLGPNVNSSSIDSFPSISTDGLTLFFGRGGTTIWATDAKIDR